MPQPRRVILRGGPDDIPRVWEMEAGHYEAQLKILRGNGYEHFEFAHQYIECEGELRPIYTWRYRTFIAE
uniref:DUF5988 family protein n=1 Tax=Streptomyces sp. NBC_00857 TaxID=2975851 RepID=UPI002F90DC0C|nr:DUF5988 family protein [Streptomyces sp. NBC_00857]